MRLSYIPMLVSLILIQEIKAQGTLLRGTTITSTSHNQEDEYVALDMDEAQRLFGENTKEGEHFRSQIAVPGSLYRGIGEDFVIVGKKELERQYLQIGGGLIDHEDEDDKQEAVFGRNKMEESGRNVEQKLTHWRRNLKAHYGGGRSNGLDANEEVEGIYIAGDVTQYSTRDLNYLLRNHAKVAFTKMWKSTTRLIVTELCSIQTERNTEAGAYYCVEGKTVCVARKSMSRFYGQHSGGGICGTLPLDDQLVDALPGSLQEAHANTCDGDNKCDGSY
jgi:hypothetical protein